jgi:hypothetical protein
VSLPVLITVAGNRWPVEECVQQGKGQTGLDQHQVRTWHSFHRHTVLSLCAQALLAIAAAPPAPPGGTPPDTSTTGQPAAWRDTGKLPASAGDRPPGDDPGLVKVSVPEARRLARLATAPISRTARDLGYAWSRWATPPPGPRPMAPLPRPATQSRPTSPNLSRRKGGPHVTNRDCSTGPPERWRRMALSPLFISGPRPVQRYPLDRNILLAANPGSFI